MAITILSQPAAYVPCYNAHWWVASSSNVAQPNFKYYVVAEDVISGMSASWAIDPNIANGYLYFNSATFAERFMTQVVPEGLYDFQLNTGGVRQIKVFIDEQYGTPPSTSTGLNATYITWNGVEPYLDYPSYSLNDYIYDRSVSRVRYITNNINPDWAYGDLGVNPYMNDEYTYSGRSNYIYTLSKSDQDVKEYLINGYDANDNLISTSSIINTYAPGTTYTNKYAFVDVGYKGLYSIPNTNVTGTYPIPIGSFAYYDIFDVVRSGFGSILVASTVFIKRIYVLEECRYDVFTLHYLAPQGSFETYNFAKISERNSTKEVSTYKQLPFYLNGSNVYTYLKNARITKMLSVEVQDSIKVNSDYITEEESARLKDLWSSPIIYVNDGNGWVAVQIKENSYRVTKKYNSKKIKVSFELEYSHKNSLQRG